MKRSAIAFLLLASYLFILLGPYSDVSGLRFVLGMSVLGLICGLNMVNALMTPRRGDGALVFLFWNVMLKLCFVPLYGICFIMVAQSGVLIKSLTTLVFMAGLMLILTTSSYGWRGLWVAKQTNLVSRDFALFHAVLQMIYVVDVLSAVYCYWRVRHEEKQQK